MDKSRIPVVGATTALLLIMVACPSGVVVDVCADPSSTECLETKEAPALVFSPGSGLNFSCDEPCDFVESALVTLTNDGGRGLSITNVSTSVSVFTAALPSTTAATLPLPTPEVPVVLEPGQTQAFEVRLATNTAAVPGSFDVEWHDGLDAYRPENLKYANIPLLIGEAANTIGAPSELSFGAVASDEIKTLPLTIQNLGDTTITQFVLSSETSTEFSLSDIPDRIDGGEEATLNVSLTANGVSFFSGAVVIADDAGSVKEVTLLGTSLDGPSLVVTSPENARIDFGQVAVGDLVESTAKVRNHGAVDLTLDVSITNGSNAGFTLPGGQAAYTVAPLETLELPVRASPTNSGTNAGTLRLDSNDVESAQLDIELVAIGTSPKVLAFPTEIDFSSVVESWSSEPTTVSVINTGTGDLVISAIEVASGGDSGFEVVLPGTLPLTLAEQDSLTFDVQFASTTLGSFQNVVEIRSNATDGTVEIPVSATSVSCADGCPLENAVASCGGNACGIAMCESGFHDSDGDALTGCECAEDPGGDVGGTCADGMSLGTIGDDCADHPEQTAFTGTLHSLSDEDIYYVRAVDDFSFACDNFGESFGIEAYLDNPPDGVEFCFRHSLDGCQENQWSCGHQSASFASGSYGTDDTTDVTIKIQFTPGANPICGEYSFRMRADRQ